MNLGRNLCKYFIRRFSEGLSLFLSLVMVLSVMFIAPVADQTVQAVAYSYFVSKSDPNANNNNAGTDPNNPWKDLSAINSRTFYEGDTILLKSGNVWSGEELLLNGHGDRQNNNWITLSSYGTGQKPVIESPSGDTDSQVIYGQPDQTRDPRTSVKVAVKIKNAEGWKIKGIEIRNAEQGIIISNNGSGTPDNGGSFDGLWIEDCYIHDIVGARIWNYVTDIAPYTALQKSFAITASLPNNWGYSNVTIKDCIIEHVDQAIWWCNGVSNFLLDGVYIYDSINGGSGFVGLEGGKIQNLTVNHTGYGASDISGIGGTGFGWCNTHSENVTTMSNVEVLDTVDELNTADGVAFDFEVGNKNCTLTNSYFHDNDGSAFLYYSNSGSYNSNLTIKNSICENNGRKDPNNIPAFLRYYRNEGGQISGNKIVKMTGQSTNAISDNLLTNGHFALGDSSWTLANAATRWVDISDPNTWSDPNTFYNEPDERYLAMSSGSSSTAKQTTSEQIAAGAPYLLSLSYKYSDTLTGTPGKAEIKFKDPNSVYISTSPVTVSLNNPASPVPWVYEKASASFTTPANTASVEVIISNGNGAPPMQIDSVELSKNLSDAQNLSDVAWPINFNLYDNDVYSAGNTVPCPSPLPIVQSNIAASPSPGPVITVSSGDSTASKIKDGIIGTDGSGEWVSTEAKPWIKLDWGTTKRIDRIRLFDRRSSSNWIQCGKLIFSDGSTVNVTGGIMNNGAMREVVFDPRDVTWVMFVVTRSTGTSVGLAELQVFEMNTSYTALTDYGNNPEQGHRGWFYEMKKGSGNYMELPWFDDLYSRGWYNAPGINVTGNRQMLSSDSSYKAVRTWVVPCAGTLSISGTASMPDPNSSGRDGVKVSILRGDNDEVIKTEQTVTYSASKDMNVSSLNVSAGDRLHFVVAENGSYHSYEGIQWNPAITYTTVQMPTPIPDFKVRLASKDYAANTSNLQGYNNWYYQYYDTAYRDMTWDTGWGCWKGDLDYALISESAQHPDVGNDSVRVWQAPATGKLTIVGRPALQSTSGTDGVIVTLKHGSTQLWTGTLTTSAPEKSHNITDISVTKGDRIYFILNENSNNANDVTEWDPVIITDVPPAVPNISYSFSDLSSDGALSGVHGGIDFGTGHWYGGGDYNGMTKCGYFSTNVSSKSFTIPAGKVLKRINLSSYTGNSTYTISDGSGPNQDVTGTITSASTPVNVFIGWTQAAQNITLTFSNGWDTTIDDIVYGNP